MDLVRLEMSAMATQTPSKLGERRAEAKSLVENAGLQGTQEYWEKQRQEIM